MRIVPLLLLSVFISACGDAKKNNGPLKEQATLNLDEVSGLQYINGTLWGNQDSGNKNKIHKIDTTNGNHTGFKIKDIKNHDWEDITKDAEGNLYIGDFGNNDNDRQDLAIYKINPAEPEEAEYTINFYYPEQKDFPPKKSERNFDCEAFFEYNGNFYLFSKNRSIKSDGVVLVHKVQNNRGYHKAETVGSFTTCSNFRRCAIAGADISPDGKTVALISGESLWLITDYKDDDFANGTVTSYSLGDVTQKEGICFKDNNTLYIADERDKHTGGKLYTLSLKDLKPNR